MDRRTLHLAVLGGLAAVTGLGAAFSGGPALLYGVTIFLGFYAVGTSGFVTAFQLAPRGVVGLHATLFAGLAVMVAIQFANRPPRTIEGRKLELKRWWTHARPGGASGTIYAEVEPDFAGALRVREFSATAAGQPVLQGDPKEQPLVAVTRGQTVLLNVGYSRLSAGEPDGFALSLKLHSGATSRAEMVDYSTDFATRKSADAVTNRLLPPASKDPAEGAQPFEHTEALKAFVTSRKGLMERCYSNTGARSALGDGSLSVRFLITPDGKADAVELEENLLGNERVAGCIVSGIDHSWTFPFKPADYVGVHYRFRFGVEGVTIDDPSF